jgi:hypothetical protein
VPAAGQCPICELPIEPDMQVWQSNRTWHHLAVRYGLIGLGTGLVVTLLYRLQFGVVPNPLLPVVAGLAVAAAALLFHRIVAGRLTGRFVALSSAGITVGTRDPRRTIPWSDVLRVRIRHEVPRIELRSEGAALPIEDVFNTPAEAAAFRKAVTEATRRRVLAEP